MDAVRLYRCVWVVPGCGIIYPFVLLCTYEIRQAGTYDLKIPWGQPRARSTRAPGMTIQGNELTQYNDGPERGHFDAN